MDKELRSELACVRIVKRSGESSLDILNRLKRCPPTELVESCLICIIDKETGFESYYMFVPKKNKLIRFVFTEELYDDRILASKLFGRLNAIPTSEFNRYNVYKTINKLIMENNGVYDGENNLHFR